MSSIWAETDLTAALSGMCNGMYLYACCWLSCSPKRFFRKSSVSCKIEVLSALDFVAVDTLRAAAEQLDNECTVQPGRVTGPRR